MSDGVVDAVVHPAFAHQDELREFMTQPYRGRGFSGTQRWFYPSPKPEWRADVVPDDGTAPASDPAKVAEHVIVDGGAEVAVLVPFTRGLMPDLEVGNDVCAATNTWLAERWLEGHEHAERFRGTVRLNADDPARAVAEIERWAGHPRMVQVAVTMQSRAPYGQRQYRPIWEAAARHGLPVLVKIDPASGIDFPPTSVGYPTHFIEYASQYPLVFTHHLLSLISEGVFEDIEGLVFVFADGGLDLAVPILWRADKDWRPSRPEIPWVSRFPSAYVDDHVRFVMNGFEGPRSGPTAARWLQVAGAARLLLYATHYPYVGRSELERYPELPERDLQQIAGGNARRLYGLTQSSPEEIAR